jgi:transcriptional regulator with XRE-family HTH domain
MLKNLTSIRRARGLTQEQLAAMADCSLSAISWYENNTHTPLLTTAVRIASALDCTIDELVSPVERNDNHAA